jgi:TonB family protein
MIEPMFMSIRHAVIVGALLGFTMAANAELRVGSSDGIKAAVVKPQPEYPAMAKQMKIGGHVEVEATVSADGSVEDVKAVTGNALLTGAVVGVVKKWKFTPFTQNGEATKAVVSLDFDFKL